MVDSLTITSEALNPSDLINLGILQAVESVKRENKAPIKLPANFRRLSLKDLETGPVMLDQLVDCYREVFGRAERDDRGVKHSWGEYLMCPEERWDRTLSIEEYDRLKTPNENEIVCSHCGKALIECYPKEELRERIINELTSNENAVLTVMTDKENTKVVGFYWGADFDGPEAIADMIGNTDYYEDNPTRAMDVRSQITELLSSNQVGKVRFDYEIGILEEYRSGFDSVRFLAMSGFEESVEDGVNGILFWTIPQSRIYALCRSLGWENLGSIGDKTFLLLRDVRPLLTLLQHEPERNMTGHMLRGYKLLPELRQG